MKLGENIADYYFAHFDLLGDDKKFHFATRLGAWNGDGRALQYLEEVKGQFVPDPCTDDQLRHVLEQLITNPPHNPINAHGLRDKYFAMYPKLRGIDFALFRVRHLQEIYGVQANNALFGLISSEELLALKNDLLADDDAIRILSTYAINYIYLLERVILKHDDPASIDIERFFELGNGYDVSNPQHVQLLIYLYTHCIIGETNFYIRRIPAHLMAGYKKMLEKLESVIRDNYDHINLDNKLEFLVCCRIVGHETKLFERIYDECERSISDEGTFLVDRHNSRAQSDRTSASASEHRNVLFIMSCSSFEPHSIRV